MVSGMIAVCVSIIQGIGVSAMHRDARELSAGYQQQLAFCSFDRLGLICVLAKLVLQDVRFLVSGHSASLSWAVLRGVECVSVVGMFCFHHLIERIETTNDLAQRLILLEGSLSPGAGGGETLGERAERDAHGRELGARQFPRQGEGDRRALCQRIDDAHRQSERTRMRKAIDDVVLALYLHIPEIFLCVNIVVSAIQFYLGINVVGNLIKLLILLWAVGEQGLFVGFHPRENAGLFRAELKRVAEIFSPISFVVSKSQFWVKRMFFLCYADLVGKTISLAVISYPLVDYFFPNFFNTPKFFRVTLPYPANFSSDVFPSQDHFRPYICKDFYPTRNCLEMLREWRGKASDSEGVVSQCLKRSEDLLNTGGLPEKDLKLIVGTLLEDRGKLSWLSNEITKAALDKICLAGLSYALRDIAGAWGREREGTASCDNSLAALRDKLRWKCLVVLQQMRDELGLELIQAVVEDERWRVWVSQRRWSDMVRNYHFYTTSQRMLGAFLGMSSTQVIENQIKEMNYTEFCVEKWLIRLYILCLGLAGSCSLSGPCSLWVGGLMGAYFLRFKERLIAVINDVQDNRIASTDVWEYLSHKDRGAASNARFQSRWRRAESEGGDVERVLHESMEELLLELGILKSSKALGEDRTAPHLEICL